MGSIIPSIRSQWTRERSATSATPRQPSGRRKPRPLDQGARLQEQPPDRQQPARRRPRQYRDTAGIGHDSGDDKPDQPLHDHEDHAGPKRSGFLSVGSSSAGWAYQTNTFLKGPSVQPSNEPLEGRLARLRRNLVRRIEFEQEHKLLRSTGRRVARSRRLSLP